MLFYLDMLPIVTILRCSKLRREDEDLEPLVKLCSSMTLRCRDTALVGEMFWSPWDDAFPNVQMPHPPIEC